MSSCGWFPMRPDEIRAWVDCHRDELPRTLEELATYPIAFRRVIVNMVEPERRVALWREHLATFLGPDSTLDDDQQAFVTETMATLQQLFAARPPNDVILEWEERLKQRFPRDRASRIFGMIGPPEPIEGLPLPPDARPSHTA